LEKQEPSPVTGDLKKSFLADLEGLNGKLLEQNLQVLDSLRGEAGVAAEEVEELKEWLMTVEKELSALAVENEEQTQARYDEKVNELLQKSEEGEDMRRENKKKVQIKVVKIEANGAGAEGGEYDSILSMLMKESEGSRRFRELGENYNVVYGSDGSVKVVESERSEETADDELIMF